MTCLDVRFVEVRVENGHLEGERLAVVLEEQHRDDLLADIALGGILLLWPRHRLDIRIAEKIAQERARFLQVGFRYVDLKIVRAVAVFGVERQNPLLLLADIELGHVRPLRARDEAYFWVPE